MPGIGAKPSPHQFRYLLFTYPFSRSTPTAIKMAEEAAENDPLKRATPNVEI
jgi:hypothetical protein